MGVKRFKDLVITLIALSIFLIPMLAIGLLIRVTSSGPVFFLSPRIGRGEVVFRMIKFRTMRVNTPLVSTDLLNEPHRFITPVGAFLRRFSLDELPQLLNVLKGDMSLVGPRPALPTQHELIELRRHYRLHELRPGITGWAQVNGRDHLTVEQKVAFDKEYRDHYSIGLDLKIYAMTAIKVLKKEGVSH